MNLRTDSCYGIGYDYLLQIEWEEVSRDPGVWWGLDENQSVSDIELQITVTVLSVRKSDEDYFQDVIPQNIQVYQFVHAWDKAEIESFHSYIEDLVYDKARTQGDT